MIGSDIAYLIFGLALVGALVGAIVYFYSRKRLDRIEAAKYTMLDDDE